jgi:hypothetical protein
MRDPIPVYVHLRRAKDLMDLIEDQGNTGLNTSDGEGPIAGSAGRTVLIGSFNPTTLGITTIELISHTGILPETQLAAMCPTLRGD